MNAEDARPEHLRGLRGARPNKRLQQTRAVQLGGREGRDPPEKAGGTPPESEQRRRPAQPGVDLAPSMDRTGWFRHRTSLGWTPRHPT